MPAAVAWSPSHWTARELLLILLLLLQQAGATKWGNGIRNEIGHWQLHSYSWFLAFLLCFAFLIFFFLGKKKEHNQGHLYDNYQCQEGKGKEKERLEAWGAK